MELGQHLSDLISRKFNSSLPVTDDQSLFYSGLIDSLGIQEIATLLSKESGTEILATDIVENDLDTIKLLLQWAEK